MANLRATQKERTRRLLLSTALELFESKAYAATTIDDIASAAGTTRVTFYAHFASRTELMRALIGELNELLKRTDSPDHGSTSEELVSAVRDGTRDGIAAWLREQESRWEQIRPYVLSAFDAAASDPELRDLIDQWFDEVTDDIATGLDQADRFDPDTRKTRGMLAMAQLDNLARHWMRHGWDVDHDAAFDLLIDSWMHLLAEPGAD